MFLAIPFCSLMPQTNILLSVVAKLTHPYHMNWCFLLTTKLLGMHINITNVFKIFIASFNSSIRISLCTNIGSQFWYYIVIPYMVTLVRPECSNYFTDKLIVGPEKWGCHMKISYSIYTHTHDTFDITNVWYSSM